MRVCKKCEETKRDNDFSKGRWSNCKKCTNKYTAVYRQRFKTNPRIFLAKTYSSIKHRLKRGKQGIKKFRAYKNVKLCFSLHDLYNFALKDNVFIRQYKNWQKHNYQNKYHPTIDRINSNGNYTLDNIQFLPSPLNSAKTSRVRPVKLLEKNLIFDNGLQASKKIGVCYMSIRFCCLKQQQTAGGYHWEFAA